MPVDMALRSLEGEVRNTLELAGGELSWHVDGTGSWQLSGRAHANLTRIVREATTNAIRHGKARLRCELTVDEQGVGATLTNPRDASEGGGGQGLTNIAERIGELGGRLDIDTDDTRFRLRLHLPREVP
jgi:two-component system sensor histidine kinase DesK